MLDSEVARLAGVDRQLVQHWAMRAGINVSKRRAARLPTSNIIRSSQDRAPSGYQPDKPTEQVLAGVGGEPRGFQHSSARALMARDSYALLPPAEISHAPPL
jgi:hypothetical protein